MARLGERLATSKTKEVTFRADRTLPYEKVLEVLVLIQDAGGTQILLSYDKKRQP